MHRSRQPRTLLVLTALLVVAVLTGAAVTAAALAPRASSPRLLVTDARLFHGVAIVKNITVGKSPEGLAFDPSNGNIYVANTHAGTVSVITGATNAVTATIKVGSNDSQVLYNPTSTEIYVLNPFSDNVSIISGATNKVVATVAVAGQPFNELYDPANGNVYVFYPGAGITSSNITMINHATHATTKIKVGVGDYSALYDPATRDLVVSDNSQHNLSIVNSSTNTVTTVVLAANLQPSALVYNAFNHDVYAVSPGTFYPKLTTGNVSVLGPANTIVATIKAGYYAFFAMYDPANHAVYVVDVGNLLLGHPFSNVTMIPSTNTGVKNIPVGKEAFYAVYNPGNRLVYVVNFNGNTTSVINSTTNKVVKTLATPFGILAFVDPNGNQLMIGTNLGTTKAGKIYVVSTANVLTATLTIGKDQRGYAYDTSNKDVYISNSASNSVTVIH
ncbi:MAG: YncE family protein [Thermoplasmata archaeon]|nr:YncE family protein [Thermoplasmata archaeon]